MSQTTHSVDLEQLINLAIEHWRLSTELTSSNSPAVKYALRKIDSFIKTCEIEARVLDGQPYDPGLAVSVVDTIEDASLDGAVERIVQTVCPMILYRGNVVRSADVVIARKSG